MIPILGTEAWVERMLSMPRAIDSMLAFYDHRLGAIVRDAHCLLVPLDDHLVHRGDGIFENIHYRHRVIVGLDAHLARLQRSAGGLGLTPPCSWEALRDIVVQVARAGGEDGGALRLLMGRGPGGFDVDPAECAQTSLYVVAHRVQPLPETLFARGLTACRSAVPVKSPQLARLKTTNYLPNVLMTLEATQRGVDVSFAFDEDGFLAEAAIANVALVDEQGALIVPEFRNALPGTTVRKAAELAAAFMPVVWRQVDEKELFAAREVLVLGTAHECMGVVRYEGCPIGAGVPGPVAVQLRHALHASMRESGVPF